VDLFTNGKRIPKCEMILEWENESVPPKRMRHKVGLQGARDHKFFLLVVDPDDEVSNKLGTQPSKTHLPSQSKCHTLCYNCILSLAGLYGSSWYLMRHKSSIPGA